MEMARPLLDFMQTYGQLLDVAGFAAEVLESLPPEHEAYYLLCGYEGDALQALGATDRAMQRYQELNDIMMRLANAEPGRADYQWDLVLSLLRIADYSVDGGAKHLQRALAILRSLEASGRLYPQQRELLTQLEAELGDDGKE